MALRMTKTDFQNYRVCPAYGWTAQHRPHDLPPATDPMEQWRARFGNEVDALAREILPGGVLIDALDMDVAVEQTLNAIERGVTRIYQGTFITDEGFLARADILDLRRDGWTLIEVKSSSVGEDGKVDRDHLWDAAFQREVIERVGLPVARVVLLLLNKGYVRGATLDVSHLLVEVDVTDKVQALAADLHVEMGAHHAALHQEAPPACQCARKTKGNWCPVRTAAVDPRGTIYEIPWIRAKQVEAFLDRGWMWLEDVDDTSLLNDQMLAGFENLLLTEEHIDLPQLRAFLEGISYPVHFLDYETVVMPIPRFRNVRPNAQDPFQFSLHVEEIDTAWHVEFLHEDPTLAHAPRWLAALQRVIGNMGSVVVWNASFERSRNREMAERYPEYATFLLGLNDRMIDLMDVVTKRMYVSPAFRGSASLKVVQPVLAPALDYSDLWVGDGSGAQAAWLEAMLPETTHARRNTLLSALRTYCGYDTEVMVVIWKRLREIAGLR